MNTLYLVPFNMKKSEFLSSNLRQKSYFENEILKKYIEFKIITLPFAPSLIWNKIL